MFSSSISRYRVSVPLPNFNSEEKKHFSLKKIGFSLSELTALGNSGNNS